MVKETARGLIIKDNKLLLIHRNKHGDIHYSIPGGKLEENESKEEGLLRELLEETSLNVKPIELLGSFESEDKSKLHHIFICEYINGEIRLGESPEMKKMKKDPLNTYEPMWIPLEEIVNLKIFPPCAEKQIKDYIKQLINK